jgi:hypothetical protein
MGRSRADATEASITGPVTGGRHGWPFGAPPFDLASRGYREDEFFLEGRAARYALSRDGERARDGRWDVVPIETMPFRTRFVVTRPIDAAAFNGTVLLSWNNVTAGFDTPVVSEGKVREGYVVVGATVQRVAVDGVGAHPKGLTVWDPERYGSLSISSDDYSFDIFTQIARAVGRDRDTTPIDPLGGLDVDTVVAYGSSQAAARLATYANAIHRLARAIDGLVLALYFGSGVPLEVGRAVVDRDDPASLAPITAGATHFVRDDLDIPVMVVNSESETMSYAPVRQPDTGRFRFWEVAGASHAAAPDLRSLAARNERDFGVTTIPPDGLNEVSTSPVMDAAFAAMRTWAAGGPPPSIQPPIQLSGEPPAIVRDDNGIARGGVRLPEVEVPTGKPDVEGNNTAGTYERWSSEELRSRYGNRRAFLSRFEAAAQAAIDAGVLLPRDRDALVADAAAHFP